MKKLCLTIIIAVFLLIFLNGVQAQNSEFKLDQLRLAQGFLGTWQQEVNKDTVIISEVQQHGNLFIENVSLIVWKNQKL